MELSLYNPHQWRAITDSQREIQWLRSIPGYQARPIPRSSSKVHLLPINSAVAMQLHLGRSTYHQAWEGRAYAVLNRVLKGAENAQVALESKSPPRFEGIYRKPFLHQWQAVAAIKHMGYRVLLADDMGLGKSMTALLAYHRFKQEGGHHGPRCLVVCPASVKWKWKAEIQALWPEQEVLVISGAPGRRRKELKGEWPEFVVINYDLLYRLEEDHQHHLDEHALRGFLVVDESHYIKDRRSKRSKFVRAFKPTGCLLLTGTPIRNTIEDLYSQLSYLGHGKTWRGYWDFMDRYMVRKEIYVAGGRKQQVVEGTKNLVELNKVVAAFQVRRLKGDVLDLPPKIRSFEPLELDIPTATIYRAMKEQWLLDFQDLSDETPIFAPGATTALHAALRCEQIASGFVGGVPPALTAAAQTHMGRARQIPGRENELVLPGSAKLTWVQEKIEDIITAGRFPVVWSRFNGPLFWLHNEIIDQGWVPKILHGAMTSEQKAQVLSDWEDGKGHVFFGQIKMAEGFDLTRSQDVIFLCRDWSPAINAQAEDRCHRIGQKGTVNIWIPIMQGTIEERMHERLEEKAGTSETVLEKWTMKDLREAM